MKFARPLLVTLAVILVIAAIGVALALTPSIQRWAVLRAAKAQPGLIFEATRISAGFSSAELTGVRVEQRGLKASIDRLEMEYSLWQILFHDRLHIHRLSVEGLLVDASGLEQKETGLKAAASPAAAPGILAQLRLPFELVLDDCQLTGRALLPGTAGRPPIDATFEIRGGKFAPNQEGSLLLTSTVNNPAADAQLGSLHAQISLRATETTDRGFSRVSLTSVFDAAGQNLSGQNQLKIVAELTKTNESEKYSLSVDTLNREATGNLLAINVSLPAGATDYAGQWVLKARKAQLEPFFLGMVLPDFDLRGEGSLTFSPSTQAIGLRGNLEAAASRLELIDPAWKAIGAVKIQAEFDVSGDRGVAQVRQLNLRIAGEKPVLEVSASQAAEINFREKRLHVGGTSGGEALNFKLQAVPVSWIAPFVQGAAVSGGAITGEFSVRGDSDQLQLRTTRPLSVDQITLLQGGETLLSQAAVKMDFSALLTEKDLDVKVGELTLQTPQGDFIKAKGNASIPVSPSPPVAVQFDYVADLPTLLAPWLRKGHLKSTGTAAFKMEAGKIEVGSFNAKVTDPGGLALVNATTLLPFTFDPASMRAVAGKAPVDLVRIELGRIPLDWFPFSQPGEVVAGTIEPATFVLKVDGEKISLRSVTPFSLAGVAVNQDGEAAFAGLTVEASPSFEMSGASSSLVKTGDVSIRNASGTVLLSMKGEATQVPAGELRANLTFNLDVPALATQPFFAGTQNVSEGRASGEIRATLAATKQVEARVTVNGLVARTGGQVLPVANLSFRATVDQDGKISLQAPLLLDRGGQRSDLNFAFDLTPSGRNFSLDGKLTGERVELTDLLSVFGVFSSNASRTAKPPPSPTGAKASPDEQSAWSRVSGHLLLDVKEATSGKDWAMTGLKGSIVIDPALVSLQKLEASFGGNSLLKAKADLKFVSGAQPYKLQGDFSLTDFDSGKLFKALDPSKAPTIEGLFTVNGNFAGSGETLERTFDRTHGKFDLTSRQGIFRGLQRTSGKVSMTSKAVELGASVLGSLLGSDKATKAAEKVAGQAYFVDQLAQSLGEFNYDQLALKLVRDESLNLTMQDISVIAPEVRLLGKGLITYVPGKPLLEQPMNVSLSFAARGKIEQLLGKLRLLDGTHDEVGYAKTKEIVTIGGSLARPDPTAFFTRIATAKITDLLDSE